MTRWSFVLVGATIWAFAWSHHVYLLAVAMPAAAITLAADGRFRDRCHARRAAALAAMAPTGATDATSVERVIAADLAAASMGDRSVIAHASKLVEHTLRDPWQRELALERLDLASRLVDELASLHGRHPTRSPWALRAPAGVVVATSVAFAIMGHRLVAAALSAAFCACTLILLQRRRSEALARVLLACAAAEPARGRIVVPEGAVIQAIRSMIEGRRRLPVMAAELIDRWPAPERDVGRDRILRAARDAHRAPSLDRDLIACGVAAAVLTAVLEVL